MYWFYVLRVKYNNTLIFSHHVQILFIIGVNHLIVFETNHLMNRKPFSSRHVRLPVRPSFVAAPAFLRVFTVHIVIFHLLAEKYVFVSS